MAKNKQTTAERDGLDSQAEARRDAERQHQEAVDNGTAIDRSELPTGTTTPAEAPAAVPLSKADKWKKLANVRLPKALKCLDQLSALGNKHQYEHTPEQLHRMMELLRVKMEEIVIRHTTKGRVVGDKASYF